MQSVDTEQRRSVIVLYLIYRFIVLLIFEHFFFFSLIYILSSVQLVLENLSKGRVRNNKSFLQVSATIAVDLFKTISPKYTVLI